MACHCRSTHVRPGASYRLKVIDVFRSLILTLRLHFILRSRFLGGTLLKLFVCLLQLTSYRSILVGQEFNILRGSKWGFRNFDAGRTQSESMFKNSFCRELVIYVSCRLRTSVQRFRGGGRPKNKPEKGETSPNTSSFRPMPPPHWCYLLQISHSYM